MITTFYCLIKAIKSGSIGWSVGSCLSYVYVVCLFDTHNVKSLFELILLKLDP